MNITIKNSARTKTIRIAIHPNGHVVVTKPKRVAQKYAERFVKEKRDWIEEKVKEIEKRRIAKEHLPASIFYLQHTRNEQTHYKREALRLVTEKITKLNKVYKFHFNAISVRNQSTRWGSCSTRKNLSFNYRIVFLPPELQDYLIVHELCHLKEMNHSKAFWSLVEVHLPEYLELRKAIKKI